jgi:hypothetical protein
MHIIWSHMLMYVGRVVFRRIIAQIFLSGQVINFEIYLRVVPSNNQSNAFPWSGIIVA